MNKQTFPPDTIVSNKDKLILMLWVHKSSNLVTQPSQSSNFSLKMLEWLRKEPWLTRAKSVKWNSTSSNLHLTSTSPSTWKLYHFGHGDLLSWSCNDIRASRCSWQPCVPLLSTSTVGPTSSCVPRMHRPPFAWIIQQLLSSRRFKWVPLCMHQQSINL